MTAPQSLPDSSIRPHRVLKFTAAFLAAFSLWAVPADSSSSTPNRDVSEMRAILAQSLLEMNHDGRLPLSGIAGGMANNVWQTISHPADPERLGCGWQSSYLLTRLQTIPGWRFEQRYGVGFSSPILLPHQWLTGYGPNGRIVQIDPWEGIAEVSEGKS